jgi:hypothetical protein
MKSALRRQTFMTTLVAVLAGIGAGSSCSRDMHVRRGRATASFTVAAE